MQMSTFTLDVDEAELLVACPSSETWRRAQTIAKYITTAP
jgi:hypothetical protein